VVAADFTSDWTSGNFPTWRRVLAPLVNHHPAILEVGSWEGRSAVFFLDFLPGSRITCVDTFAGSAEHDPAVAAGTERRFDANTARHADRVEKIKGDSAAVLARLLGEGRRFDLIYIDGAHEANRVLIDSALCWPMLAVDGILIWDDYAAPDADAPRQAVDAFLLLQAGNFVRVAKGWQMIVRRTSDDPPHRKPKLARSLIRRL
jgi:predicted O-methyltransferase YrrM